MYVYEALQWASSFLEKKGRERRAADVLMKEQLGLSWTDFHLARREPLSVEAWQKFQTGVLAHSEGIPIQHLTGYEEFFGRRFTVNDQVLIPRPETEELVLGVLSWMKKHPEATAVADIGTGSGAIAITLALEMPGRDVTAVDINEAALAVARKNAEALQAKVTFKRGDLTAPLIETQKSWNVIASNPPYIPVADWQELDPLVRDHEPEIALVGRDEDGLFCYRKIAVSLPGLLTKPGLAAFEVGVGQGHEVARIMKQALPDAVVDVRYDINGKDRMVFCERPHGR
ncbi:peptide chain release factor N(5)-glutamine methyltransferase [Bacillus piscicola]|uniref:peptide chain release factor N(5)-glutamine methyltransferase n=1 Tax=Bacillus piscicola TaxID=1632684 RepID=UPI001F08951A|nr:peptide chain release factor N(5)-glutamine methyltransferase [Bacillus piscicola]